MVPLFAGVIIAGLGIGALLSAFAARHIPAPVQSNTPLVVMHTPTPIAAATQTRVTATPSPTPRATAKPASTATSKPSAKPTPTATATSKPTPTPAQTEKPPVAATVTKTATPAPTSTPTPARTPVPTAAAAVAVQSSPAEALVRKFLEAVAHGDDTTAYGTLGGTAPLGEAQFLDPTMRITSMTTGRSPAGGTNVQVEFRTSRGEYFGTFVVDSSSSRIIQREVIPVGGTTAR